MSCEFDKYYYLVQRFVFKYVFQLITVSICVKFTGIIRTRALKTKYSSMQWNPESH